MKHANKNTHQKKKKKNQHVNQYRKKETSICHLPVPQEFSDSDFSTKFQLGTAAWNYPVCYCKIVEKMIFHSTCRISIFWQQKFHCQNFKCRILLGHLKCHCSFSVQNLHFWAKNFDFWAQNLQFLSTESDFPGCRIFIFWAWNFWGTDLYHYKLLGNAITWQMHNSTGSVYIG